MAQTAYTTPAVRRAAAQLGVDLTHVQGTGAGGRVTVADVRAADPRGTRTVRPAGTPAPAADLTPAPASRFAPPRLVMEWRSQFAYGATVELDAFATNPLLEDIRVTNPEELAAAIAHDSNVPTMFSGGDVPLFTSTGFDPQLVLRLPWIVRHKAAAVDKGTEVAEIFERCGSGTAGAVYAGELLGADHDGLKTYLGRFKQWLSARHQIVVPKALTLADLHPPKSRQQLLDEWADELGGQ